MGICEELSSILSLPEVQERVDDKAVPVWNGDVIIYAVGSMVESLGGDTVSSFFTGDTLPSTREHSDLSESIDSILLYRVPASVSEAASYFSDSLELWESAFSGQMLQGNLGECWVSDKSVEPLYEASFADWAQQLREKYGFAPSGFRTDREAGEIREICDDILSSLDEGRREKIVDINSLKIAAKLLS